MEEIQSRPGGIGEVLQSFHQNGMTGLVQQWAPVKLSRRIQVISKAQSWQQWNCRQHRPANRALSGRGENRPCRYRASRHQAHGVQRPRHSRGAAYGYDARRRWITAVGARPHNVEAVRRNADYREQGRTDAQGMSVPSACCVLASSARPSPIVISVVALVAKGRASK